MCGIAGFITNSQRDSEGLKVLVQRMADALYTRGPDSSGTWVDPQKGVALGHRRLSILDLSPTGNQPMVSYTGRYVIVFNGEIYNYRALLEELNRHPDQNLVRLRGNSDTEVLLVAIEVFGLQEAVNKLVGMFAFALWDRDECLLHLVRDRMGEKPLYYTQQNGNFLFGSELKALLAYPDFQGEIDRNSLTLFLRHNYIPAPFSIYKNVFKLNPGHILTLNLLTGELNNTAYWSMSTVIHYANTTPFSGSEQDAIEELEGLLRQSVREQMVADVPLGAFLSGGVDSSTIVAMMQSQSVAPIKTFSIGFHEGDYNEAGFAKEVANYLGTDHTELYVTAQQSLDVIPKLPTLYDEPFSDSSQIPTFLLSSLAKEHVTVSLSGDGGDELFGGYTRYMVANSMWRKLNLMPKHARDLAARSIKRVSIDTWNKTMFPIAKRFRDAGSIGDKLHKAAEIMTIDEFNDFYRNLVSHWKNPADIVLHSVEPDTVFQQGKDNIHFSTLFDNMMYLDTISYLPNDILVKVDRAAMGVSLESRIPMLNHRIVEFAARMPISMKIKHGQGKWLLRQILYRYVPKELIDRPKKGFGVPIASWLRGPLREWAEELLSESRLRQEGYFSPGAVREKWEEHVSGKRNWHYYLWDILMFQSWLEDKKA